MLIEIDDKRKTILSHNGHLLIKGGPGSGKTTIGLLKAKHSVPNLSPHTNILFLSFSRAAVHQIRTCSQTAELNFSKEERKSIGIQTYHSFLWQVLQSYGSLVGIPQPFNVLLPEDEEVQRNLFPKDWVQNREQFARDGNMSYDLFPKYASKLLKENEYICQLISQRFPIFIVDEFQDTNDHEYDFIKTLSKTSTVVFLADSEQRIYDFREGVTDNRIEVMEKEVNPLVVDLAGDNYRSPKSDIWKYANGVLTSSCQQVQEEHISQKLYQIRKQPAFGRQQSTIIKTAYLSMERQLTKVHGVNQPAIAIVARTNSMVTAISDWLNNTEGRIPVAIRHVIDIDHTKLMFSWRFLACILENRQDTTNLCLMGLMTVIRNFEVCSSQKPHTAQAKALKYDRWIKKVESGNAPNTKLCRELTGMIERAKEISLTGNISLDCRVILRQVLLERAKETWSIVGLLCARLPFQQPDRITEELSSGFASSGTYERLAELLTQSITFQKLKESSTRTPRCTLLTIHKSKGKEFDGMIIYDSFGQRGRLHGSDKSKNYSESRRLLRVAITRARKCVLIIMASKDPSPLLPTIVP